MTTIPGGVTPNLPANTGKDLAPAMAGLAAEERVRNAAQLPQRGVTTEHVGIDENGAAGIIKRQGPPMKYDWPKPDDMTERKVQTAAEMGLQRPEVTERDVRAQDVKMAKTLEIAKDDYYMRRFPISDPASLDYLEKIRPGIGQRMNDGLTQKYAIMAEVERAKYIPPRNAAEAEFEWRLNNTDVFKEYKNIIENISRLENEAVNSNGQSFGLSTKEIWGDIFSFAGEKVMAPPTRGRDGISNANRGLGMGAGGEGTNRNTSAAHYNGVTNTLNRGPLASWTT